VLEAVLDDYAGTILLVTHDRYLIDALGTQIWEVEPDESTLSLFEGTYSQRRVERERLAALHAGEVTKTVSPRTVRRSVDPAAKEERRRIARLQELENKIAALEAELSQAGFRLETPPTDPAKVAQLGKEYQRIQLEMDVWLAEWEQLQG
jgi:ATP-binding cassette subfamily F protein 3